MNDVSISLLDLIIIDSGTLPSVSTSDSCVIYCYADRPVASSSSYKRRIKDFNHADFEGLIAALCSIQFDEICDLYTDIDIILNHWMALSLGSFHIVFQRQTMCYT